MKPRWASFPPKFSGILRSFSQILFRFPWIFPVYSGNLPGFYQIKTFGVRLQPRLLHNCGQLYRSCIPNLSYILNLTRNNLEQFCTAANKITSEHFFLRVYLIRHCLSNVHLRNCRFYCNLSYKVLAETLVYQFNFNKLTRYLTII